LQKTNAKTTNPTRTVSRFDLAGTSELKGGFFMKKMTMAMSQTQTIRAGYEETIHSMF
jgi:hypothetical protein